jgi:ADP-heptose:LPS heptosyltransferase
MHTIQRQAEQLEHAGIAATPLPDVSWAAADIARFMLPPGPGVILVPGGAAHRPEKRWPVARYAALAQRLALQGFVPIVIGGTDEMPLGAAIAKRCATACDLTGDTSLGEIVGLARHARHAIGNDTGPMHLVVAAGCPATVLYSAASDPALTAPRGAAVTVLRRDNLAVLSVEEVAATLAMD